MNPFNQGYMDGLYEGVADNPYTNAEDRVTYRQGYNRGVFMYCQSLKGEEQCLKNL